MAAVKVSMEAFGILKMLGSSLKHATCATSSSPDDESTGPTVVGILFFIVRLNTRVLFLFVISNALVKGGVKL